MNTDIRPIKSEEIHLMNFIIFGRNIPCLKSGHLTINSIETDCGSLQVFEIRSEFEIINGGKKMRNYVQVNRKDLTSVLIIDSRTCQ